MVAAALPNLITELDGAVNSGSPERADRMLKQVTSLFMSNADRLGDAQVGVLDDVLLRLIGRAETGSLVQLSESLSTIDQAPRGTVRTLAFHNDASVAGPILKNSSRLSDKDLVEIALTMSQQHLQAICERKALGEALTDALLRRGDASVSNALANNPGAVFSECGYATLVGRAERDENLTEKLGLRLDMPANLLREILTFATDVVRARFLTASRPTSQGKPAAEAKKPRPSKNDYTQALSQAAALGRVGKLNDPAVNRFAVNREYVNVVAALALKADVGVEVIEPFLESDRLYALIVTCKAARLDWSTVRMIINNRPGCQPITKQELEQSRAIFDNLLLSVAQWTVRFASEHM